MRRAAAVRPRSGLRRRALVGSAALAVPLPSIRAVAGLGSVLPSSTRWSLVTRDGICWLITPGGQRFFSLGVNTLDGRSRRRGDGGEPRASPPADWAATARRRLARWGFNSAGAWSLPPRILRLPTIVDLELGRRARFHWFDPFAPETAEHMLGEARDLVAPYRRTPYRIGYFSDNEVGWWAGALFVFYAAKPASSATKKRWVAMLHRYYDGDWRRFTADFVPPAGIFSWPALLAATRITRLRPGGAGIHAVHKWTGLVAAQYYRLAAAAIRAADPEALYFGDRLPIYYDPSAVRAMAPHVDAIATNYNLDAADGWIARYYFDGLRKLASGKPVLVSEWFFAARENRSGNRNNGHLMTVDTQAERAAGAARATANLAAIPQIVGAHWFQYRDDPNGGRADGEDYDFGLVDADDQPYRQLTEALAAANRQAPAIHARSAPAKGAAAQVFAVPHAAVSVRDHSLADWPKPASLLPPLTASPGEVAFGEAYLSWSEHGLALATIGQDYYDLDLLAYEGAFPLGEAYRAEFGVDFGPGPRLCTMFFIPPRTKEHDYPEMRVQLCAGSAARAIAQGGIPIPGAQAVYFGADQPRITAELRLPWAALGIGPPSIGAQLRAEIAVTSWHRGRWMSLSGLAPDPAMRNPAVWRPMRLG